MGQPRIRLLCVDDNDLVCSAMERKFASDDDYEWCGSLPDASGLVDRATECRPDVVFLDLDMPGPDALGELARLRKIVPTCRVIVLSGIYSASLVEKALDAGAAGYLSKAESSLEILGAVERVARGETVLGTELKLAIGLGPLFK